MSALGANRTCRDGGNDVTHSGSSGRIRRTGRYGISCSLRFETRELFHLAPLVGIFGNESSELGGRAWEHEAAKFVESACHLNIHESRVNLPVERVYYRGRCTPGRADAGPEAR